MDRTLAAVPEKSVPRCVPPESSTKRLGENSSQFAQDSFALGAGEQFRSHIEDRSRANDAGRLSILAGVEDA